jgi:transcriptional regulator with XRE-family HTH domain
MRDFGEILAENRKKKGYSQSDLVDLLSQEGIQVTTKAISKWETNAREPALHVFLTLCQLLDIEDIYESFFGENPYNIMSGLNEEGRNKLIEFADILKASKKFSPCCFIPLLVKVRRTGKMQKNLTGSIGNKNVVRLWTGYQKNQELNGL